MEERPEIRVRRAGLADVATLASLAPQLGYEVTESEVEERFAALPAVDEVLVAEVLADGSGPDERPELIGWIHLTVERTLLGAPHAAVYGLVVAREWRRLGVGRLLMRHAEGYARRMGLHLIRLRSNIIRDDAHRFYERLGYEEAKRQVLFVRALTREDGV